MSIRLKSEELRRYFRNNGVVTEQMAKSIFNRMNIELVTTTDGKVSQDLLDDLRLIKSTYPQLLRHTTIINNTGSSANMQPIIDILSEYPNKSYDTLKSVTIKSKYDRDYDLDFSRLKGLERITLSGGNRVSKVTFSTDKLPKSYSSKHGLELELENFDLTGLDLSKTKIESFKVTGRGTRNFSRVQGLEKIKTFTIANKDLDREFYDMVDFINGSKSNVSTLVIDGVNLSTERPFEMLKSPNLVQLEIKKSKVNNLDGLDKWTNKLTSLEVYGNDLGENDLPKILDFMKKCPHAYVDFKDNVGITRFFNSLSTETFSEHTRRNIYNSLLTVDGPRDVKNKDVLQKLLDDPTIPFSITDAEVVRGQAGIKLNPIEIPNGVNLETIDFNKPYLKGGTLLVSPAQLEELKKFKKLPKDMEIAVRIRSAKELTSEQIKSMHFESGVNKVYMMNEDGVQNTRAPYTASEYFHTRRILDEVVQGIDPNEKDINKFTTVYARLADTIKYDMSAIDRSSPNRLRYAGRQRHNSRNLKNGLVDGKCVCLGYAEILRNALSLVDVKSKVLVGRCFDDPDYRDRHAWNAVELEDENNVKRWYFTDMTWDAGKVLTGKPEYMLLDEETFNKKGHQVYETYYKPEGSDKPYDREKLKASIEQASKRMVNPRNSYIEKRNKAREENKKRQEEQKKPKKEEQPKKEEVKPKENLALEEEKRRRDSYRRQLDEIYKIINENEDLDTIAKIRYQLKLSILEDIMQEVEKKIASYERAEKEPSNGVEKRETRIADSGNKKKDEREMPDVEFKEVPEVKLTAEQEQEDRELKEVIEQGGVSRILPAVRDRADLIKIKKQDMLTKAENSFVGFTNKLFRRQDDKPPKFISGIIKMSLGVSFWVKDRIRDIRDRDDDIDDELMSIAMTSPEVVEKQNKDIFEEKYELNIPNNSGRKKTIAEKEAERLSKKAEAKDRSR